MPEGFGSIGILRFEIRYPISFRKCFPLGALSLIGYQIRVLTCGPSKWGVSDGDQSPASVAMPDSGVVEAAPELEGREGVFEPGARLRFYALQRARDGVTQLGESLGVALYRGRLGGKLRVREDESQDVIGGAVARRLRGQFLDDRVDEAGSLFFD